MKNSPLSALVLFGIAGLVGGVAWFATSHDRIEGEAAVIQAPKTPKVVAMTPYEKKLAQRLEDAKAEIEKWRAEGETLPSGEIRVKDVNDNWLYVHPELIEGVGRFGEPLYMQATYMKRAPVPLQKKFRSPSKEAHPKMKVMPKGQSAISITKKPEQKAGAGGGGGGGEQGGGKPDDPTDPKKPSDRTDG